MFEDLYDAISLLWSWRWPETQGQVTAVDIERVKDPEGVETFRLAVAYKFSIGDDGPYTGESFWRPAFVASETKVLAARDHVCVHQPVLVRYRPGDPSISKLDRSVWQNLQRHKLD